MDFGFGLRCLVWDPSISKIDKTALFENYYIIENLLVNAQLSTLVLEKTGHHVFDTEESDKEQIFSEIFKFTNNILNE